MSTTQAAGGFIPHHTINPTQPTPTLTGTPEVFGRTSPCTGPALLGAGHTASPTLSSGHTPAPHVTSISLTSASQCIAFIN